MGVLGILGVQALCSFAIIAYFRREASDGFHWWKTGLAPFLGGIGQMGAMYLLVDGRATLGGAADAAFIKYFAPAVLVIFLAGAGYALYLKASKGDTYSNIGAFEADEPMIEEALHGTAPRRATTTAPTP